MLAEDAAEASARTGHERSYLFGLFTVVHGLAIQQIFPVLYDAGQHWYRFYDSMAGSVNLGSLLNPTILIHEAPYIDKVCFALTLLFMWIAYFFNVNGLFRITDKRYSLVDVSLDITVSLLIFMAAKSLENYDPESLQRQHGTWMLCGIVTALFTTRLLYGCVVMVPVFNPPSLSLDTIRSLLRYVHLLVIMLCVLSVGYVYDRACITMDGTVRPFQHAIILYMFGMLLFRGLAYSAILWRHNATYPKAFWSWPLREEARTVHAFVVIAVVALLASLWWLDDVAVWTFPMRASIPLGVMLMAPIFVFVVLRAATITWTHARSIVRMARRDPFDSSAKSQMRALRQLMKRLHNIDIDWILYRQVAMRLPGGRSRVLESYHWDLDGPDERNVVVSAMRAFVSALHRLENQSGHRVVPDDSALFFVDNYLGGSAPSHDGDVQPVPLDVQVPAEYDFVRTMAVGYVAQYRNPARRQDIRLVLAILGPRDAGDLLKSPWTRGGLETAILSFARIGHVGTADRRGAPGTWSESGTFQGGQQTPASPADIVSAS